MDPRSDLKVSIGIPVYNEEDVVVELINRVTDVFGASEFNNFEIVVTDNNSTDRTFELLEIIAKKQGSKVKLIKHARNYGYQTSLQTCLENSDGDYVALMDGDLQDPPELLPIMIRCLLDNNVNIVYGVRVTRKGSKLSNYLYKKFYTIWQKLADIEIQIDSGEFAIYDRFSVDQILKFRERNRFLRGIRAYLGLVQKGFPYEREVRFNGKSKFNYRQQFRLAFDGIYSFSFAPIRLIMTLGILVFAISLIFSLVSILFRIANILHPDFNIGQMGDGLVQIFFLFTMLFGVIIIILGIIGEYLGRIYDEIRQRPVVIEKVVKS